MASIWTALGPLDPAVLGRTLMHEHVLCDFYRVTGLLNQLLNDEFLAIGELELLVQAGGAALVDCTTIDLGRDAKALRRISQQSGVHIVLGTGWYRELFYPPEIDRRTVADLADLMVRELTEGIADTGIRAGIIGEIGVNLDYVTGARGARFAQCGASAAPYWGASFDACLDVSGGAGPTCHSYGRGRRSLASHHRPWRYLP